MNQASVDRRGSWLRLAAVIMVIVILIAVVFVSRVTNDSEDLQPLNANDTMSLWSAASPEQKSATADMLLDVLRAEHHLGPQTSTQLDSPAGREGLVDQLIAGLDEATNRDVKAYVSPGQSLVRTAESVARRTGWDK